MVFPKCDQPDGCNGAHQWHGLRCPSHGCNCPSPYDDDYWTEGDGE